MKFILVAALLIGSTLGQKLENIDANKLAGQAFDELCKKAQVTDEQVVTKVKGSTNVFTECLQTFVNQTVIQNEIEEAKPRGALDEVFKKYCDKSQVLKGCINNLLTSITPCIEQAQHNFIDDVKKGTDQLIDFVCYKDGDRIALFIAESGPECFTSKAENLKSCGENAKSLVTDYQSSNKVSKDKICQQYDDLSKCVVDILETCDTPTPANMMESLFRFIKKESPCAKKK